ncbi:MAG: hypothetical protein LBI57_00360 [Helicobacteraceae bacterium]|jgi:CRISPR-associated protein Csm4|nr:hypothetical protein [Helicobacteraceae bacterium]
MRLFKTKISPVSNFATSLRGDTLFGHLCWMIRFRFGNDRLTRLLRNYEESPFMIVSDAFVAGLLPKPRLPLSYFQGAGGDKKTERKKRWIKPDDLQTLTGARELKLDEEKDRYIVRNSINYKTFTTDDEGFAPYESRETSIGEKDIYIAIDEEAFPLDDLTETFKLLEQYGYGKDNTIGKGRFSVVSTNEADDLFAPAGAKTFMALSPFSPCGLTCKHIFYEPFTRFGKKGASRSRENPFKKPLLLADTASVVAFERPYEKRYIGRAIRGHTTHGDIVHQGYAIVVAIKEIA